MSRKRNKITVGIFNKMFAIRYFLYLAYAFGWVFFSFFIILDLNKNKTLRIDNHLFLIFFLISLGAFLSYFLVIFLLAKTNTIRLKPVLKLFSAIVIVTFAFFLLQFFGLLKIYGLVNLGLRTIFFAFFPASIVFGFVGITLSSQLFINWQRSFLKSNYSNHKRRK